MAEETDTRPLKGVYLMKVLLVRVPQYHMGKYATPSAFPLG